MAVFKCKMCGGDLNITEADKVVECEYCGTTQTVPSADNEKKMTLFNRANRLRLRVFIDGHFSVVNPPRLDISADHVTPEVRHSNHPNQPKVIGECRI